MTEDDLLRITASLPGKSIDIERLVFIVRQEFPHVPHGEVLLLIRETLPLGRNRVFL